MRSAAPGRSDRARELEALAAAPPGRPPGAGADAEPLVEALDPAINRLVAQTAARRPARRGVGLGTELAQLRPYETGDDVRHIDAAASARTGTLHVRLHVPERALTTWIVLDLSPSMAFGTARRLKADVAEGAALVFGRLGLRRAGSVGVVAFGAGRRAGVLPPRGSKPGMVALRRLLEEGVAPDGREDADALADALARVGRLARQPGLVVVISDFRDQHEWERPLGALRLRHAVIAIEVVDPREGELPAVGQLMLVDPETGGLIQVNTGRRRLRERFAALERERREAVAAELRRLRVQHTTPLDRSGLARRAGTPDGMSFAAPLWLLALALVPAGVAAESWPGAGAPRATPCGSRPCRRCVRRRVDAAWGRHVPSALALAAVALLAVALARPHVTHRIPTGQADMMLVLDHSGSMAANDVQPNRLAAAVSAANTFIDQLPSSVRVGAVGFSSTPDSVQRPVANHAQARSLMDSLVPNGGTDTGDALQLALQLLQGSNRKHPPSAIVLLSDGAANAGSAR